MARQKHGFLLFDLPSDHEIDTRLSTECEIVKSVLHNRRMGSRVKIIRATTEETLDSYPPYKSEVQFVHLACHGGPDGIGLIGGALEWRQIARRLARHLKKLKANERRVCAISCCHSSAGYTQLSQSMPDYFSGWYHFADDTIPFATAITTWAMFYHEKTLSQPHARICDRIEQFFGKRLLIFRK